MVERKPRAPQHVIQSLTEAHQRLLRENSRRSEQVSEHLNALPARSYLDSWVVPEVEQALAWARGEPKRWDGSYVLPNEE